MVGAFRFEPFAEQDAVGEDAIVEFWRRETGMPEEVARRRAQELLLVVLDEDDRPVAVSTAFLHRSEQLHMVLWQVRAIVAAAHRRSDIGITLAQRVRDLLRERFDAGDRRGAGVLFEVENEALKRHMNTALWHRTDFTFIGETPGGAHVRIHFFPGVRAPDPPA